MSLTAGYLTCVALFLLVIVIGYAAQVSADARQERRERRLRDTTERVSKLHTETQARLARIRAAMAADYSDPRPEREVLDRLDRIRASMGTPGQRQPVTYRNTGRYAQVAGMDCPILERVN